MKVKQQVICFIVLSNINNNYEDINILFGQRNLWKLYDILLPHAGTGNNIISYQILSDITFLADNNGWKKLRKWKKHDQKRV